MLEGICELRRVGECVYPDVLELDNVRFRRVVTRSSKDLYSCINADQSQDSISLVAQMRLLATIDYSPRNCSMERHVVGVTLRTDGGVSGVENAAEPREALSCLLLRLLLIFHEYDIETLW